MEESTWKTVTLKLKRIACLNFELITFQLLQSPIPMQNLSHWWYYSWSGWNTFMDIVALDGWWILPFVKYFCSLVQLHYSLLSSFTRKQQLAKYHTAFVLDFWSSLQTTFAQPKDRWARRWAPFTWPSFFYGDQLPPWFLGGQLPSSHRRTCLPPSQEDLELLLEDLLAQQTGRNVELFTGSWVSGKLKSSLLTRLGLLFNFLNVGLQLWHNFHPLNILLPSKTCYSNRFLSCF